MKVYKKVELGRYGEQIVVEYLQKNKYKILKRNFYSKQGEIDIIAKDRNEIVFIEVKTRTNVNFGRPSESVNIIKQKHIYEAAKYFLYKSGLLDRLIRIDVVEVLIDNEKFNINHIKQIM